MKKKMKWIMIGFLTLLVLSPALVFSEVTLKEIKGPDGTTQMVFYSGGKEIAKQIKDKHGNTLKTIGKVPDGLITQYYDSGKVRAEINYKNGKREGKSRMYFENGVVEEEINFKNDIRHGTYRRYNKDWSLQTELVFENGALSKINKL